MLTRFMYGTQEQIDKARRNDKNIVPASVYFNKGTGALILSLRNSPNSDLEEPEKELENSFQKYIEDQLRISY